jgi:recombinational DNA repair ATPase RecF
VFLIDDAGAELDLAHNTRFFSLLERLGGQILATTTQYPSKKHNQPGREPHTGMFHVEHGSVTPT